MGSEIHILGTQDEQRLTVTITDEGAGISAEMLPQVFDLFTRNSRDSHGGRHTHTGLGTGMTLARRLVELHGGKISAHSDGPGLGSRFVVQLNLLHVPVPRADAAVTESVAATPERQGTRILIVDDNRDGAQGLAMMLDLAGHEVRTATDGLEALDIAEEFRPQVVLLDISMPGIDGYETARRLRALTLGTSHFAVRADRLGSGR